MKDAAADAAPTPRRDRHAVLTRAGCQEGRTGHDKAGPAPTDAPEAKPAVIAPARQAEAAPAVGQSEQPRPVALTWTVVEKR